MIILTSRHSLSCLLSSMVYVSDIHWDLSWGSGSDHVLVFLDSVVVAWGFQFSKDLGMSDQLLH